MLWKEPIRFRIQREHPESAAGRGARRVISWSNLRVTLGDFTLRVERGEAVAGQVVGIVGPNGIGKTTFVKLLAGELKPEEGYVDLAWPEGEARISYKPQYVSAEMFPDATVLEILRSVNPEAVTPGSWLYLELTRKLRMDKLFDRSARSLSGGELQKLALCIALAREADVYLLDEPSAYLDVEERLNVARIVRRLAETREVVVFVVEHDIMIADFISDSLMVFQGEPGVEGLASSPMLVKRGMNVLLSNLGITMRRDPESGRPRVNKEGSYLDRMQKARGEFYW
jgi:ATP-binding cassette subfamily E protein 1